MLFKEFKILWADTGIETKCISIKGKLVLLSGLYGNFRIKIERYITVVERVKSSEVTIHSKEAFNYVKTTLELRISK